MSFTGTWTVQELRHIGSSRAPSGDAWVTILTCGPNTQQDGGASQDCPTKDVMAGRALDRVTVKAKLPRDDLRLAEDVARDCAMKLDDLLGAILASGIHQLNDAEMRAKVTARFLIKSTGAKQ